MPRRLPIIMARVAVSAGAAGLAILVAELVVRLIAPVPDPIPHWQWEAVPDNSHSTYTVDDDLGFRPVLGSGEYSDFGTVVNHYPLAKSAGTTRLLFLGDSVTHRWRMQEILVNRCRDSPVEFWNAGVEGFNTGQEVEYYLRWNHRVEPDHVTLVFHNNDFVATPVLFRDDDDELVVVNPHAYLSKRNVALAGWSHLYRHYLRARISRMLENDPITTEKETRAALSELKRDLDANGIGFNIILVPVFKPLEDWTAYEKRSRALSLEIFEELGIPFYDLIEPLKSAVGEGIVLTESPGDIWHPSDQIARRSARHLIRKNYLESVLGPGGCRAPSSPADLQPVPEPQ
ncbi:MAG: hypothetical protein GY769_12005 [bacterium]|nr:hypothetical protein [bacterium]